MQHPKEAYKFQMQKLRNIILDAEAQLEILQEMIEHDTKEGD